MPKSAHPLPRSECLCSICREILLEPVTLPCNHTLCHPCFQMTVEKASLCCPFCRLRVSSWARRNARSGTLINQELWEIIQRQYPEECKRRASGLDTEEDDFEDGFTPYPTPQLCKPGEIRKEYEAEISKIEEERLKREDEERRASEEYIQKLLAEEETEQRLSLERSQRDLEEQMKKDEELAWMLNSDLNESTTSSGHVSLVESPVIHKKTVSTKSCKNVKNNRTQPGDIERFLTPKSVKIRGTEGSGYVRNGDLQHIIMGAEHFSALQDELDDDGMPTLSPQSYVLPNQSSLEESDSEQLPGLTKYSPIRNALLIKESSENKILGQTITNDSCLAMTTLQFSPPRCSNSLDFSRRWHNPQLLDVTSIPELQNKQSPKRTLEFFGNPPSEKRPCLDNCITPESHTNRLKELEETLHERKLQEEQDRLMALRLQKLLDKELKQVSRLKGSPDEYKLRPKRTAAQQEPLQSTPLKRADLKQSMDQSSSKSSESGESSDENKKPAPKKHLQSLPRRSRTRKASEHCSSPNGVKILKPSNKQQNILDMFQRSARK
ncbi:E3 ubiquitin-protein ligase RNF168 [Pyxicephalus adspersus]|uniref:RING-type E3 ubiquitin transferase n=1 Tax=Pyxicephalus adspersus TaxID=30357 RepID=A0AAV3AV11_PYXAD|nr:TPA: hypothetical protein GDO54_010209 [Pyxicephalus adspersus]